MTARDSSRAEQSVLELSGSDMRGLVDAAMDHIVAHIDSLAEQPVSYAKGGEDLARSLVEDLPETGVPFDELLQLIFGRVVETTYNTASPGYLAYIPGGGLLHTAIADLIADAINRYVGVWVASPGFVQLEANVCRWLCQMVGFPTEGQGLLTSGSSMASFIALVCARRERLPEDFLGGRLYCSDQVHHSITKAALLAGFSARNIRVVPSDEYFRMRLDRLRDMIAEDRDAGHTPFLVVGSAGTVNTGAVDDFEALADIARAEKLWLHIDGAYGGFFVLTERGRETLRGIERADSVALDPHKGLFLPYGTGALVVRDRQALMRAHHVSADYMPVLQDGVEFVDFSQISPELSRNFRGLRVWLPLKMHGIGPFRAALDEKLDLARWISAELAKIDDMEIVAAPELSILAFRLHPAGLGEDALTDLNGRLRDAINARQNVFVTATTVSGRYVIRICVLSFRTHLDRMQRCLEDIRAAVHDVS